MANTREVNDDFYMGIRRGIPLVLTPKEFIYRNMCGRKKRILHRMYISPRQHWPSVALFLTLRHNRKINMLHQLNIDPLLYGFQNANLITFIRHVGPIFVIYSTCIVFLNSVHYACCP